jgi:arylsulfatase A-like enzyme
LTEARSTESQASRTSPRLRDVLLVIASAALAGALGEVALILGARLVLERITMLNPQGIWLAPIANLFVIGVPALLIWFVVRLINRGWALPSATAVAAFLAALEPLLVLKGRLHIAAMLVLAAGVGVQAALLMRRHPVGTRRWVAAIAILLAAVSVTGGLGFNLARGARERRFVDGLPAATDGAPNVLLLVLDTVRALSLSAYGYARPTSPTMAALAARGVKFNLAVAPAPWTLPSHASMFTGRYPHELSAGWSTPLDGTFPTLAERLTTVGYATAGFAANLHYCSYEFGVTRGFGYYRDYDVSVNEMWRSSALSSAFGLWLVQRLGGYSAPGRLFADRMNERMLAWFDNDRLRDPKRPFFAFVNYYDAHGPYDPPAPFDTLFTGREPPTRDSGSRDFTKEEVDGLLDAYDASIAYLDRQLGELFAALEKRGLLRNTIVIITSDHGEEFNEHGQMNHGNTLYFPSLHVPLILSGNGIPEGVSVAQPVTLRDLPATVLDLIGAPARAALPGQSLARHWRNRADSLGAPGDAASPIYGEVDYARNLPSSIPVSQGSMKSVVVDGHHFIRGADGSEDLFDVRNDPWERKNLLSLPALGDIVLRARSLVEDARARDVRRSSAAPNATR